MPKKPPGFEFPDAEAPADVQMYLVTEEIHKRYTRLTEEFPDASVQDRMLSIHLQTGMRKPSIQFFMVMAFPKMSTEEIYDGEDWGL